MSKSTKIERIELLKNELGVNWSELGRLAGRSRQAVNSWRQGGAVSAEAALELQAKANVNPAWLLHGRGKMFLSVDSASQKAALFVSSLPPEDQDRALAILQAAFRN